MTKKKWRAELKRREINAHREREIEEQNRRRLVGVKSVPAAGWDGNTATRAVFVPTGAPSR